jgi:hypothetical protein
MGTLFVICLFVVLFQDWGGYDSYYEEGYWVNTLGED